jgi:hypothetical protein
VRVTVGRVAPDASITFGGQDIRNARIARSAVLTIETIGTTASARERIAGAYAEVVNGTPRVVLPVGATAEDLWTAVGEGPVELPVRGRS